MFGEFAKTMLECLCASIWVGRPLFSIRRKLADEVVVEHMAVAGCVATMGQYFEPRHLARPSNEVRALAKLARLAPHDDVRVLQHVPGVVRIGQQRQDVREQRLLTAGQGAYERFIWDVFAHKRRATSGCWIPGLWRHIV